jgi:hypothetical protein
MNDAIKALVAAQKAMTKATKATNNPAFRTKYADLGAVQDACFPALHDNGFAVLQPVGRDEGGEYVDTILLHESGPEFRARIYLLLGKRDMQGFGSAVTYARRYGLMSLAGIAPEDDDGNAAVVKPDNVTRRAGDVTNAKPPSPDISARGLTKTDGDVPMLSRRDGEAIIFGINAQNDIADLDAYMAALRSGPMAFAADHEKIRAAYDVRKQMLGEPTAADYLATG